MSTREAEQARRNRNPHKAARIAMILWAKSYASQAGGSMDFWDALTNNQKRLCREILEEINAAPAEVR